MATLSQALTDLTSNVTKLLADVQTENSNIVTVLDALKNAPNITPEQVAQIESAAQSVATADASVTTASQQLAAAIPPPVTPPAAPATPTA